MMSKFCLREVDFLFTCLNELVEILDKTMGIKMNDCEYAIWTS